MQSWGWYTLFAGNAHTYSSLIAPALKCVGVLNTNNKEKLVTPCWYQVVRPFAFWTAWIPNL